MSLKVCKACGEAYRKGRKALVFEAGGAKMGRVCGDCARAGLLVVALRRPVVVQKKEVASDGVAKALRMLRTYRAATDDDRKAEGLDVAIETLRQLERVPS